MRLSDFLYRASRAARDGEAIGTALAEGSPAPIARRIGNRLIGRALARFANFLWIKQ